MSIIKSHKCDFWILFQMRLSMGIRITFVQMTITINLD